MEKEKSCFQRQYEERCAQEEKEKMVKRYRTPLELLNALKMTNEGSLFYDLLGLCKEAAASLQIVIDGEEARHKAALAAKETEEKLALAAKETEAKHAEAKTIDEDRVCGIVQYGAYVSLSHEPSAAEQATLVNAIINELHAVMFLAQHLESVQIIYHCPGDEITTSWNNDPLNHGSLSAKPLCLKERWTIGVKFGIIKCENISPNVYDLTDRFRLQVGVDGFCLNEGI